MEVLVKIPDDLNKYIEYVPEQELPEMMVNALKCYIKAKTSNENKSTNTPDLSELINLLQKQAVVPQTSIGAQPYISVEKKDSAEFVEEKEVSVPKEVQFTTEDLVDSELDEDLLDMMK